MDKKKTNAHAGEWKPVLCKLLWLLIIPAGYGLSKLASAYPALTEKYFSSGIYGYISSAIGFIMSFAKGISVAEMLVYAAVVAIATLIIINIVKLVSGKLRFAKLISFILSLAVFAGVLFNLFYIVWGFNYSRPTLSTLMGLNVEPRSASELQKLSITLARRAADIRENVDEDEDGVFTLKEGYEVYFDQIPAAYHDLGKSEPLFSRKTYPVKPVLASVGMSYAGIAGVFFPFTAEANVNVDQPSLLLPVSAAHETAHYLGVAREDEANFVAYLACTHSDIPAIEYSGVMLALINCMNKLYAADKDLYYEVREIYTNAMVRDLTAYNAYWASFEGPVEEKVNSINDNYLKFNQQENGVKSYGMMVDLLLAYYSKAS